MVARGDPKGTIMRTPNQHVIFGDVQNRDVRTIAEECGFRIEGEPQSVGYYKKYKKASAVQGAAAREFNSDGLPSVTVVGMLNSGLYVGYWMRLVL